MLSGCCAGKEGNNDIVPAADPDRKEELDQDMRWGFGDLFDLGGVNLEWECPGAAVDVDLWKGRGVEGSQGW